jgi:protein-tyrosine phosphatase
VIVVRKSVPFRVLYVCAANVCRSPTAALLTQRLLGPEATSSGLEVRSAGTVAVEGAAWCSRAASWVGNSHDGDGFRDAHRSRRIGGDDIDCANLIMTADRQIRSTLLSSRPQATARTFTIREAAALAGPIRPEALRGLGDQASLDDVLGRLVEEMNASRGRIQVGPVPADRDRHRWQRRSGTHSPYDIADAHGPERVKHTRMLRELASAVRDWTATVHEILAVADRG